MQPSSKSVSKIPAIICLMGPTAAGKTALAINLAQTLPCEIISVDSGMIYRGMDIGTAKPTAAEQAIAPHQLIDIRDPAATYSAAQFRLDALQAIEEILQRGKIPLLVGGTMLYFKVLQQGISALPHADTAIRTKLTQEAAEQGWQKLYEKLREIDPVTAARLSPSDAQRIQRALEVYEISGKPISELCAANPPVALPYNFINFAVAPAQRSMLQERIAKRLQLMLQQGLIEEGERLFKRGDLHVDLPSMRTVGYRQVWRYLAGEVERQTMEELILIATRQLAKRQMTWLRSWPGVKWLDSEDGGNNKLSGILKLVLGHALT